MQFRCKTIRGAVGCYFGRQMRHATTGFIMSTTSSQIESAGAVLNDIAWGKWIVPPSSLNFVSGYGKSCSDASKP